MSYNELISNTLNSGILIIDDEPDICYLLSTLFKQKKLDVNIASSLSMAAIELQKHNPSLIFLDNHLPDGMGINFIGYIKQHHPATKIIMITAHDTFTDKQNAIAEGADCFIAKPFSKDIIFNAVEEVKNKKLITQL